MTICLNFLLMCAKHQNFRSNNVLNLFFVLYASKRFCCDIMSVVSIGIGRQKFRQWESISLLICCLQYCVRSSFAGMAANSFDGGTRTRNLQIACRNCDASVMKFCTMMHRSLSRCLCATPKTSFRPRYGTVHLPLLSVRGERRREKVDTPLYLSSSSPPHVHETQPKSHKPSNGKYNIDPPKR
jgi:hypothetical protein